ncbi:MAG: hypothetical protein ACTSXV_01905 [Alphaproteobacteria bacterium]
MKFKILLGFLAVFFLWNSTGYSGAYERPRDRAKASGYSMYSNPGSPIYHAEGRSRVRTVRKEDCVYEIKTCLDEFCYDEYDGYEACKDNGITDFYGVVETCLGSTANSVQRKSYAKSCKPYMDSAINNYIKQIKSFRRYQMDMDECEDARTTLKAAQSCYGIAVARGGAKSKTLKSLLTKACGGEIEGGGELMVEEFWGAGHMGADAAGWATNFAMLNFGSKQHGWQKVVDATLARYIDIKRVACGEGEYTVGEVGKYSAKLTNAGDAARLGVASAILKKNMQTQQQANSVGEVQFLDVQNESGDTMFDGVNPASGESDAQHRLSVATMALATGKTVGNYTQGLEDIYYETPTAGDVLIWYQYKESPKCYTFIVMDPDTGGVEPISKIRLQQMKMINKELERYYEKCFK